MTKYTPVMNEPVRSCLGLQRRFDRFPPKNAGTNFTETPAMTSPGVPTANPITKGDYTAGRGRYEKGRKNKSRS